MKKIITGTLTALVFVAVAGADTLTLQSGATVDGTYFGGDSRKVRFIDADGRVGTHLVADVAGISFGDAPAAAVAPISAPQPMAASSSGQLSAPQPTATSNVAAVPAGTVVTIRMIDAIDSDSADVGSAYAASLEDAIVVDGVEIAPRGADATVRVASVEQAGRISGRSEVALELASLFINGREVAVVSNFAELESKSKTMQTAKTAGAGAAIGAIIGAIAGGGKGAAIGAATGGGAGTVYSATRGSRVQVPSETLLTFAVREDISF
jgi:hypothetical protein